jgi:hypothetical protein
MCCFSQPVQAVSQTSIFARAMPLGRQLLVYEMTVASRVEVAMVLPLPVPPSPSEDAVRFINLEGYPQFFEDMRAGFPEPRTRSLAVPVAGPALQRLVVHDVGAFEASFVPRVADFERLDPRFRLPAQTWHELPAYLDWGFAVFKLKGLSSNPKPIHPMALDFPRRDPARLFYPTVHIHDGAVHPTARFDHALYCQSSDALPGWQPSNAVASAFMPKAVALGLAEPSVRCQQRKLHGKLPNADTYL